MNKGLVLAQPEGRRGMQKEIVLWVGAPVQQHLGSEARLEVALTLSPVLVLSHLLLNPAQSNKSPVIHKYNCGTNESPGP